MVTLELTPVHRPIPWDVLILIFRASDLPTLAALGLVSFDFFVSSSAILYRDVEVDSFEQLDQLFYYRAGHQTPPLPSSRIYPHLSLSRIQTLSLNFTSLQNVPFPDPGEPQLSLSFSRLANTSLLVPLDTLRLSITHSHKHMVSPLYRVLLPRLDPLHFEYTVTDRSLDKGIWTTLYHDKTTILAQWRRLATLSFKGGIPIRDPGDPPFGSAVPKKPTLLAALRAPRIERRRELRMDVASLFTSRLYSTAGSFMKLFVVNEGLFGLGGMQEGSIVLVVRTERERVELEAGVEKLAREKWRKLFVVEVEEQT